MFIELDSVAKNGQKEPIQLVVDHIVYVRKFNPERDGSDKTEKNSNLAAIFTPTKMIVVTESPKEVRRRAEEAKKSLYLLTN